MSQRTRFMRFVGVLVCAIVAAILFVTACREQELWKFVGTDGSATTVVGQQRWFGLSGIHLVRRERDGTGRFVSATVVGHAGAWSDAKSKANALHRQAYLSDSTLYFEENIHPLVTVMSQAAEVVAYEGLPHQNFERELLAKELRSNQSVTRGNFPFYARPVPIRQEDVKRLLALCSTESSFSPFRGGKACGGFHPDWCLLWRGSAGECRVLLCFGCSEARVSCGAEQEFWTDLDQGARQEIVAILQPYRTNRPAR